ncbi:MAG: anti-sigma regulatory factor [Desulfobacteraceae bacterium]|jgi:anti-sigma regulatory factor (Ser/Thr protein kinase)|nr:MAG: anti-sigma regulatory factor [Desulfobacteraceae bacterium]
MAHLTKTYPIKARDYLKAGEVSMEIHGLMKKIGFDSDLIRRVSICAYEAEMNVVMHGGDGVLNVEIGSESINLNVKDSGPGIEDIGLAMQEGFSTATEEARQMGFGAGMGLPNIKKNSDRLEIISDKGMGTEVRVGFTV